MPFSPDDLTGKTSVNDVDSVSLGLCPGQGQSGAGHGHKDNKDSQACGGLQEGFFWKINMVWGLFCGGRAVWNAVSLRPIQNSSTIYTAMQGNLVF